MGSQPLSRIKILEFDGTLRIEVNQKTYDSRPSVVRTTEIGRQQRESFMS